MLGNVVFKVCGAEVDSSWQSVRNGVVAAGAPREKRLVLGALSSAAASLRFTSDALHSCLLGSWVSALLMRRQAMAAINELFRVIPSAELDPVRPHLHRLPRAAGMSSFCFPVWHRFSAPIWLLLSHRRSSRPMPLWRKVVLLRQKLTSS